jgi:hypothetical protein
VKVTDCPTAAGFAVEDSVVVVWPTDSLGVSDPELPAKLESPVYAALTVWELAVGQLLGGVNCAVALLPSTATVTATGALGVPPSMTNCTVPPESAVVDVRAGPGGPTALVIVAVKVTAWLGYAGLEDDDTAVAVGPWVTVSAAGVVVAVHAVLMSVYTAWYW